MAGNKRKRNNDRIFSGNTYDPYGARPAHFSPPPQNQPHRERTPRPPDHVRGWNEQDLGRSAQEMRRGPWGRERDDEEPEIEFKGARAGREPDRGMAYQPGTWPGRAGPSGDRRGQRDHTVPGPSHRPTQPRARRPPPREATIVDLTISSGEEERATRGPPKRPRTSVPERTEDSVIVISSDSEPEILPRSPPRAGLSRTSESARSQAGVNHPRPPASRHDSVIQLEDDEEMPLPASPTPVHLLPHPPASWAPGRDLSVPRESSPEWEEMVALDAEIRATPMDVDRNQPVGDIVSHGVVLAETEEDHQEQRPAGALLDESLVDQRLESPPEEETTMVTYVPRDNPFGRSTLDELEDGELVEDGFQVEPLSEPRSTGQRAMAVIPPTDQAVPDPATAGRSAGLLLDGSEAELPSQPVPVVETAMVLSSPPDQSLPSPEPDGKIAGLLLDGLEAERLSPPLRGDEAAVVVFSLPCQSLASPAAEGRVEDLLDGSKAHPPSPPAPEEERTVVFFASHEGSFVQSVPEGPVTAGGMQDFDVNGPSEPAPASDAALVVYEPPQPRVKARSPDEGLARGLLEASEVAEPSKSADATETVMVPYAPSGQSFRVPTPKARLEAGLLEGIGVMHSSEPVLADPAPMTLLVPRDEPPHVSSEDLATEQAGRKFLMAMRNSVSNELKNDSLNQSALVGSAVLEDEPLKPLADSDSILPPAVDVATTDDERTLVTSALLQGTDEPMLADDRVVRSPGRPDTNTANASLREVTDDPAARYIRMYEERLRERGTYQVDSVSLEEEAVPGPGMDLALIVSKVIEPPTVASDKTIARETSASVPEAPTQDVKEVSDAPVQAKVPSCFEEMMVASRRALEEHETLMRREERDLDTSTNATEAPEEDELVDTPIDRHSPHSDDETAESMSEEAGECTTLTAAQDDSEEDELWAEDEEVLSIASPVASMSLHDSDEQDRAMDVDEREDPSSDQESAISTPDLPQNDWSAPMSTPPNRILLSTGSAIMPHHSNSQESPPKIHRSTQPTARQAAREPGSWFCLTLNCGTLNPPAATQCERCASAKMRQPTREQPKPCYDPGCSQGPFTDAEAWLIHVRTYRHAATEDSASVYKTASMIGNIPMPGSRTAPSSIATTGEILYQDLKQSEERRDADGAADETRFPERPATAPRSPSLSPVPPEEMTDEEDEEDDIMERPPSTSTRPSSWSPYSAAGPSTPRSMLPLKAQTISPDRVTFGASTFLAPSASTSNTRAKFQNYAPICAATRPLSAPPKPSMLRTSIERRDPDIVSNASVHAISSKLSQPYSLSPPSPGSSELRVSPRLERRTTMLDYVREREKMRRHRVPEAKEICSISDLTQPVLQDAMMGLPANALARSSFQAMFEAHIHESTLLDEPDAPRIEIVNEVDDEPCPAPVFVYTNKIVYSHDVVLPDLDALHGCDCEGPCNPKSTTCACIKRQMEYPGNAVKGFVYDAKGRLRSDTAPLVIVECNSACNCSSDCRNRVIQRGRTSDIVIQKTEGKGWGVFTRTPIPKGTFIGRYSGELLTDAEAEQRGFAYDQEGCTYLFDVDFYHLLQKRVEAGGDPNDDSILFAMDAYHYGNFTRFLNHSCTPNLTMHAAYINETDVQKPLLVMYSNRYIAAEEELCFSYHGVHDDSSQDASKPDRAGYMPCMCESDNCRGFMFG